MVVALALAACTAVLPPPPRGQDLAPWQQALRDLGPVTAAALPDDAAAFRFGEHATLVVLHDGDADDVHWTDAQRHGLAEVVEQGGRVLLLGHAAALAAAIGLEPERPEARRYRWGFDRRAAPGRARLGLAVVTGREPLLFDGLTAAAGHEHTFFLAGGEPCDAPLCAWSVGAPQRGEVLARLAIERDAVHEVDDAPVLVRWTHGQGVVLALGLVPDVAHGDPTVRGNAVAFLRAAVQALRPDAAGRLVLLTVPHRAADAPRAVTPAFAARPQPDLPLLAHWGWRAPLADEATDGLRTADELARDVLLPSWLAGADLLEVEIADAAARPPLAWARRDPLKRPDAWPDAADRPLWNVAEARTLAAEAHARGMLLLGQIEPLTAAARTAERCAALRFVARELADLRRLGDGAFDGLGVADGWRDAGGTAVAMLQDFQPAGLLYSSGERAGGFAGGLRALDADDGAVAGLGVAGLSARWRDGFAADAFPLGVLDARARRDDTDVRDGAAGGGSHGDWIVTQANDFVRARAGLGGAMWWRRFAPDAFAADSIAYVHGVSLEPMVAAVAMRLSATGRDGHRAAARALLDEAPAGFGADSAAPAAVHVLQNNWFRLAGSGGALQFDPQGRARFRDGEAALVAQSFLRTRLYGARPDLDLPAGNGVDLLAGGLAGAGGHGGTVRVTSDGTAVLPGLLGFDRVPEWPAAAAVEWRGGVGYHELDFALRGVDGRGIVAISLDGALLTCVPVRAGDVARGVVPLHVTGSGPRTLQFELLEGGAIAFDRLRIVRQGDVGAAARVVEPAGSLARLEECSSSSLHRERTDLTAIADLPGFVLRVQWESAARGLQVERRFQLPGYRVPDDDLRQPFVLAATDRALPDIVVAPLQLGRHDSFSVDDGALVLHSAPQVGSQQRLGFLLVDRARSAAVRQAAVALCRAIEQPTAIDLAATGEAVLHPGLDLPWTRVVRLDGAVTTPVLVQENGWWTWRGTQPAADGGRYLRVRHEPDDVVRLVSGPAVLARTRPGPGSLHVLALRDPEPLAVTVQIGQPSRVAPPCVVMGADFDEVLLDGAPWAWFDGRTVFLPDRPGTYRIECRRHGGGPGPGVRRTRAPLVSCTWDPARRALVLVAPPLPGRPVELPWTAVLRGPRPSHITNGEIVADAALPHADAEAKAAAARGGTLIRFRSGTTEVFLGP